MTTEILDKPEIVATDEHTEAVLSKAFVRAGLTKGRHGWRRLKNLRDLPAKGMARLFIVCTLDDLTREKIAKIRRLKQLKGRDKVFLLLKGKMPSRAVADRIAWLDVRDDSRVHFAETTKEDEERFVERLLTALDCAANERRILDAWWEEETLVVVSLNRIGYDKIRVPLAKLPALKEHARDTLDRFEIDEDGLFVYWPQLDIHLGWDQFEATVSPQACLKAKQQSEVFNRSYGSAIRTLRTKSGLRQVDIGGLTSRQVGRIENGACRATHSALMRLAQAHRMTLSDYMDALASLL